MLPLASPQLMLPSPMPFSPFSSSSSSLNLRTTEYSHCYLLSSSEIQYNQMINKYPPQITSSNIPLSSFLLLLLLSLLQPSLSGQPAVTLCDQAFRALQNKNQTLLNQTLDLLEQRLFPKYFWAQNMTHLLLKFEFLNSADTSACTKVLLTNKHVEHSQISLSLICTQSNLLLRYRIKIKTFMPVNFYHAVWKTAEQNSLILVCPKSPSPYFWKSLYLPNHAPLRKPKIWWKMMEKYRQNLQKFIYDLQVQQGEEQVSASVKKRWSVRKHKYSELYNPQSSIYLYCNQNSPFHLGSWLT